MALCLHSIHTIYHHTIQTISWFGHYVFLSWTSIPNLIFISGHINHVKTEIMVDCGATMTIISEKLANQQSKVQWELQPTLTATAVTGHRVKIIAVGKVVIRLGKQSFTHKVHVQPDCPCDCILGSDFLKKFKMRIDFGTEHLILPSGGQIPFSESSEVIFNARLSADLEGKVVVIENATSALKKTWTFPCQSTGHSKERHSTSSST